MAESEPDNRLVLTGRVVASPRIRRSPAGIPIAHFGLEHESVLPEADIQRRHRFRIEVKAVGEALCKAVGALKSNDRVRVLGHLTRGSRDSEDYRLLILARRIERQEMGSEPGDD